MSRLSLSSFADTFLTLGSKSSSSKATSFEVASTHASKSQSIQTIRRLKHASTEQLLGRTIHLLLPYLHSSSIISLQRVSKAINKCYNDCIKYNDCPQYEKKVTNLKEILSSVKLFTKIAKHIRIEFPPKIAEFPQGEYYHLIYFQNSIHQVYIRTIHDTSHEQKIVSQSDPSQKNLEPCNIQALIKENRKIFTPKHTTQFSEIVSYELILTENHKLSSDQIKLLIDVIDSLNIKVKTDKISSKDFKYVECKSRLGKLAWDLAAYIFAKFQNRSGI